jgi:hypothetical protein
MIPSWLISLLIGLVPTILVTIAITSKPKRRGHAERTTTAVPDASNAQTADIERRMTLIRDQLDSLQVTVSEKKKPWYRNSSTILSLLALAISTAFGVNAIYDKLIADRYAKREQIRDFMSRMLDLDHDYYTRDALLQDKDLLEDAEDAIDKKRNLYLENIGRLEREIRTSLTFNEYVVLASQSESVQNPSLAKEYYVKARAQAASRNDRLLITQYIGSFYFHAGALRNPDLGRKSYEEALAVAREGANESREYDAAMVLAAWAESAHAREFFPEAYAKMAAAADEIAKLGDGTRLRQVGVENLQQRIDDWNSKGETLASAPDLQRRLEAIGIKTKPK